MKVAALMNNPWVYRVWQAPFAERKIGPVFRHNDLRRVRRVLDVGCGPGTNTRHFSHCDYIGIDHNPAYIDEARRRYSRSFVLADVTAYEAPPHETYDFILLNSFLHHVDTPSATRILAHVRNLLTENGHIHVLDLVMPERPSIARLLARWDRGDYPRPLKEWREILSSLFEPLVFEPYALRSMGVTLWNMVYFKGKLP